MSRWNFPLSLLCVITFMNLMSVNLNAQTQPSARDIQVVRFTSGTSALRIPFELSNNLIIVPVRVNGSRPLHFIFDTGASISVLDPGTARSMRLRESGKLKLDATGGSVQSGTIKELSLAISGVEVRHQTVATVPLDSMSPLFGFKIDGIIGYHFIKNFVVEIDYKNSLLNLYEPTTYNYSGTGDLVPITLVEGTPLVRGKLMLANREPIEGQFEVDTGGDGMLGLNTPFVKTHKLLESLPNQMQSKLGGAGGTSAAIKARVSGIQVGNVTVRDPLVVFAQGTEGSEGSTEYDGELGGAFFKQAKLIIDYSRSRIILDAYDSSPRVEDLSGLEIFAEGPRFTTFVVNGVTPNTPASAAGLKEEDVIVGVDGRAASTMTLSQLRKMFMETGKQFRLRVRRGKRTISLEIQL